MVGGGPGLRSLGVGGRARLGGRVRVPLPDPSRIEPTTCTGRSPKEESIDGAIRQRTGFPVRKARWVRMQVLEHGSNFGASFFEARVLGPPDGDPVPVDKAAGQPALCRPRARGRPRFGSRARDRRGFGYPLEQRVPGRPSGGRSDLGSLGPWTRSSWNYQGDVVWSSCRSTYGDARFRARRNREHLLPRAQAEAPFTARAGAW